MNGSSVESCFERRRALVLETLRASRFRAVVVELFPFGRKKHAPELLPLLEEAHRRGADRPLLVSSVRDLLVGRGERQLEHDERACELANRYFDAILVHADPRFARLEDSFRPSSPLRVPVYYTGFVTRGPWPPARRPASDRAPLLVSAGGGAAGEPLFRDALEARKLLAGTDVPRMRIIGGPLLSDHAWRGLRATAKGGEAIELVRSVPDLEAELVRASASVSQCGYNAALAILRTRVPALVVPFAEAGEDEQTRRARRLDELGAVRVLDPRRLDAHTLAEEIERLFEFRPTAVDLDLDGASATARLLASGVRAP